jgi:CheY-like chemotaxis protein/anti-sigma regulatory factor (Ser/Thr protein kinase)
MARTTPCVEEQPAPGKAALVVDSDPCVDAVLKLVLGPETWTIRHAPNNMAALAMAESDTCDLILTSEKTSGKEDVELLRKIRRVRPHIRLIILTDESTPEDILASMRERAFSYFSKPYSAESLAQMIRLAAEGPCWDDGIEVLSGTPAWIRLAARCELNTAERLIQFIGEISELPETEKSGVALAFREMLLNAMEHGGNFDPNEYVEIAYLRARKMLICRIKDPGQGFSLDEVRHITLASPGEAPFQHIHAREAQGMRPGGYGVLLARHFVDELIYGEQGNDVLLIKYLQFPSHQAVAP